MKFWKKKKQNKSTSKNDAVVEREYIAEALEARILYSAAPADALAPVEEVETVQGSNLTAQEAGLESIASFEESAAREVTPIDDSATPLSGQMVHLTSLDNLTDDKIALLTEASAPAAPGSNLTAPAEIEIASDQIGSLLLPDDFDAAALAAQADALKEVAIDLWVREGDISAEQAAALEQVDVHIVDLDPTILGAAAGMDIYLDWNAAGLDWFIDETPLENEEFSPTSYSTLRATDLEAASAVDMLTILTHEMGHVLGLPDSSVRADGIMYGYFGEGERRLLMDGLADGAEVGSLEGVQYATADEVVLSTDFTGRTVSGTTASNITWTTNGIQDPGDLTASEIPDGTAHLTSLFVTPAAAGHFAPDLNIHNEGTWQTDVPLVLSVTDLTLTRAVLDVQAFGNTGNAQSGRDMDFTVEVIGSTSGTLLTQSVDDTTTPGPVEFTFASPLHLTSAETYVLRITGSGDGPGNNSGLDALTVYGAPTAVDDDNSYAATVDGPSIAIPVLLNDTDPNNDALSIDPASLTTSVHGATLSALGEASAITNVTLVNGYELQDLTLTMGGTAVTLTADQLIGIDVTQFAGQNTTSLFLQDGASAPAAGSRAGVLDTDNRLDTGLTNPLRGTIAQMNAGTNIGTTLQFDQAVSGAVMFEVWANNDPINVQVSSDGVNWSNAVAFNTWDETISGLPAAGTMPFDLGRPASTPGSLNDLETSSVTTAAGATQAVAGMVINASAFTGVTSFTHLRYSSADTDTVDPSFVRGIPPVVIYDPSTASASGTVSDTFTYKAIDGNGGEDTATVTVSLTGVTAVDDDNSYTATVGGDSIAIPVLLNDTNPNDLSIDPASLTTSTNGATLTASGEASAITNVNLVNDYELHDLTLTMGGTAVTLTADQLIGIDVTQFAGNNTSTLFLQDGASAPAAGSRAEVLDTDNRLDTALANPIRGSIAQMEAGTNIGTTLQFDQAVSGAVMFEIWSNNDPINVQVSSDGVTWSNAVAFNTWDETITGLPAAGTMPVDVFSGTSTTLNDVETNAFSKASDANSALAGMVINASAFTGVSSFTHLRYSSAENDSVDPSFVRGIPPVVIYDPSTASASGTVSDTFTYKAIDGNGGEDTATVTVSLTGVTAVDDDNNYTATVGGDSIAIPVLLNDTNPNDLSIDPASLTTSANGATLTASGEASAITNVNLVNGYELQDLTLTMGGTAVTLTPDRLIGIDVTQFAGQNNTTLFLQDGASAPATGTRAEVLDTDNRLDTGLTNPLQGSIAQMEAGTNIGTTLQFDQAVNGAVMFEVWANNDPINVQVSSDGVTWSNAVAFNSWDSAITGLPAAGTMPFDVGRPASTPGSISDVENNSFTTAGGQNQAVAGMVINASAFSGVTSFTHLRYSSADNDTVDPSFVRGIPPVVIYDPTTASASGTVSDTFTYKAIDGNGGEDTATVTVTLAGPVIYVNDTWTQQSDITGGDGDLEATGTQNGTFGTDAFGTLADAVNALATAGDATLIINAGDYSGETLDLSGFSNNVTVKFVEGDSTIGGLIGGANVTVELGGVDGVHITPVNLTVGGSNASTTFAGTISGSGTLTKAGTGTLTLDGTVSVATLDAQAGLVDINGTTNIGGTGLTVTGPADVVIDGVVQDLDYQSALATGTAGTLTKSGAGTLTLNGDNTYSGDTTVNDGTLLVNGDSSGTPLDPTDSDFVLWLRADQGILDGSGNAPGDGGFNASDVATWQDQSGNGNHFTQGTSTARPTYVASDATLNNQPVLSFDGTSDFLRNAGLNPSGEFTVLAVTEVNNSTFFDGYLGGGSDRIAFGVNGSANHHPNTFVAWTPGDQSTYGLDNSINTDWNLHAYQVAGLDESQWTWSLNGTPTGGPGLTSGLASAYNNGLWVGSSGSSTEFWDGNIAEIIVFDRALSAQELSEAQHLLAARYGLTVANTTAPTGGGTITVKNSATLGGTGTAGGSVVVEAGGTLDPGESGIGTLTVTGDATINGNLATEIGSGAANTDLLSVGGTLDVANATLVGSGTGDQAEYVIASYNSAATDPTAFNAVTAPAGYEVQFDAANDQIKLSLPPTAVDDDNSYTATVGGPSIAIPVLLNDTDPNNDALSIDPASLTTSVHGATLSALGEASGITNVTLVNGYELQDLTLTMGGTAVTVTADQLIGIDVTQFTGNSTSTLFLENGTSAPAAGSRAGLLDTDNRLDTALANPLVGSIAQMNAGTNIGTTLQFDQAVSGAVMFEVWANNDPINVQVSSDGVTWSNAVRFDTWDETIPGLPAPSSMPFDVFSGTSTTLNDVENNSFSKSADATQALAGMVINASAFTGVTSFTHLRYSSADSDTVDPSFVRGIPPVVIYDPSNATAFGTVSDSFTYKAIDGNGGEDTATVTVSLTGQGGPDVRTASPGLTQTGDDYDLTSLTREGVTYTNLVSATAGSATASTGVYSTDSLANNATDINTALTGNRLSNGLIDPATTDFTFAKPVTDINTAIYFGEITTSLIQAAGNVIITPLDADGNEIPGWFLDLDESHFSTADPRDAMTGLSGTSDTLYPVLTSFLISDFRDGSGTLTEVHGIRVTGVTELPAAILPGQGAGGNLDLLETGGSLVAGNIASQSAGAVAFAHDVINHPTHAIAEVNDGIYGNDSSWIGATDNSFVGVKFAEASSIDAIAWGRSNTNAHNDRDLGTYTIQYTTDAALNTANPGAVTWQTIDSVTYTGSYPDGTPHLRHLWGFDAIHNVTGVRIITDSINDGTPLAIDELEVHSVPVTVDPNVAGTFALNVFYIDDTWVQQSDITGDDGDLEASGTQTATFDFNAFGTLANAVAALPTTGDVTLVVNSGDYSGETLDLSGFSNNITVKFVEGDSSVARIIGGANISVELGGVDGVHDTPVNLTVGGDDASTTFAGTISGSGTLTKAGSGTLTLDGTVSVATIDAQAGLVDINGTTNVGSGLTVTGPADVTIDGVVQDGVVDFATQAAANGAVGHWSLNETSGTTAVNNGSAGATLDGTHVNSPTPGAADVNGDKDGATDFGGNASGDHITVSGFDSVAGGNPFENDWTIEAWFVRDSLNAWSAIASNNYDNEVEDNGRQGPGMMFIGGTDRLGFAAVGRSSANVSVDLGADSLGKPVYAIITKTGGNGVNEATITVHANVDGVWLTSATGTNSGGSIQANDGFYIGRQRTNALTMHDGIIDEVAVYNRALSLDEVQAHYATRIGGLTKSGSGTLTLNGANTFRGDATVTAGTVVVGNADALGATSGETTVNTGGTLLLDGGITLGTETVTLNGTATLLSQSGNNTMTGNLVLGSGTPEIQVAAGQLEVDGSVSGTGFQKTGAGDLVIDGTVAVSTIDAQAGGTDINGATYIGDGLTVTGPADVVIDGVVQNGTGAYDEVVADDGAVAHWRLNETSGAAIDVIGGQNGTYTNFTGGNRGVTSGQGDGGANFDGSNDHIVGTLNDTHFDGDWTIEAWFTRDDANTDWNGIFSANQNVTQAPLMTFFNAGNGNNRHWLGMNNAGVSATPDIYVDLNQFGGGGGAYLGEQIYATMSLSGTTLTMNVNVAGTWLPTVTRNLGRALNTTSTGYTIGRHWHNGLYHDGIIDEVAIYDRALSTSEIQAHYAGIGDLTKSGDGTLTLNGANTYTSGTTVSGGTLDGTGTVGGNLTVDAGGTVDPGESGIGTLTVNGNATISGNLAIEVGSGAANTDLLSVGGTLDVANASLLVTGAGDQAEYVIASYTGTDPTAFSSVTAPVGYEAEFDATNNQIKLSLNLPPTAVDDDNNYTATVGGPSIAIPVLLNDTDPDNDALSIDPASLTTSVHGATLSASGEASAITNVTLVNDYELQDLTLTMGGTAVTLTPDQLIGIDVIQFAGQNNTTLFLRDGASAPAAGSRAGLLDTDNRLDTALANPAVGSIAQMNAGTNIGTTLQFDQAVSGAVMFEVWANNDPINVQVSSDGVTWSNAVEFNTWDSTISGLPAAGTMPFDLGRPASTPGSLSDVETNSFTTAAGANQALAGMVINASAFTGVTSFTHLRYSSADTDTVDPSFVRGIPPVVIYDPGTATSSGIDTFTYKAIDEIGGEDTATVTVTLAGPPVVYVNDTWTQQSDITSGDGDLEATGTQSAAFDANAFGSLADAVAALDATGDATLIINAGDYSGETLDLSGFSNNVTVKFVEGDSTIGGIIGGANVSVELGGVDGVHTTPINLTVGGSNASTTFAGTIAGSGTLTKAGSGTLTLDGTVSVATIDAQAGQVDINGTTNIGTGLTVTGPADVTIDGVVQDGILDYQAAVLADNPISYWTFDEAGSGTAAANDTGSGGSVDDGTFEGTATRTAGLRGTAGAAQFNDTANDGVNVGNGADFLAATFSGGITIETLFTTDYDGNGHEEFFRKEDGNNRILLSFQHNIGPNGGISFGINAGGYSELDISLDGAGGRPTLASIADGNEHHLAATYDPVSGTRAVYLDGVLIGSDNRGAGTALSTTGSGGANAIIGNLASGSEPFGGTIDEMAIYNRALSQAEIQAHYAEPGGLTKTGNGTLTLNGTNTFTGEATVSGGTVVVGNADALGATSGETAVNAGATLQLDGGVTLAAETVTLTDTATLLSQSGNNTMSGNLVLNGPGTPEIQVAAGQLEVDGSVSGNGFQKSGAGDLVVDGALAVSTIDAQAGGTDINGSTDIGGGLTVTGPADVTIDGVVQDGAGDFATFAAGDGAVAVWSLNETSGTTAVNSGTAGATLNGTHVNDPTLGAADVNGDGDAATDFDGQQNASGDHIAVSGLDSVAGGNPFENDWTIEAWFVRDTQNAWSGIASNNFDNAEADNGRQGPIMTMRNNTHQLGFMAAGVTEDGVYVDLGAASLGKPVYAVITKTGGNTQGNATITVHANVDGTWLTSATGSNARDIRANDGFYIGRHWSSTNQGGHLHDGAIDEVAVYDRALTLSEIQAHYAGLGGLTKSGDGTLTLNGANTFTGDATVSGGTVVVGNTDALGATSGETTVESGATLAVSGGVTVAAETITLEGAATVENVSGNNTLTGAVTTVGDGSGSATLLATAGTLELDGAVSLANTLTIDGAGDVTIDGVVQDIGAGTPYQAAVQADEPISYWTFDEANSGTAATSDTGTGGSADDGTFEGTATRTGGLGGTTGAALFTDTAGERVNAGTGSDFSSAAFAGGMTIETLFTADYDGSGFEYFFRKEDGNNRILLGFQRSQNMEGHGGGTVVGTGTNPGIAFGINVDGTYSELDIKFDGQDGRPTLAQVADGNEHHLAATYDPVTGTRSVYLDGVLIGSDNRGAGNAITTTAPGGQIAAIGNTSSGTGPDPFGGVIDEMAIYGKALTAAQIQAHLNAERNLVMDGDGTLTLTAANTYSGETTVNTGTLAATNADALGSTGVGTTVNTGGTLLVDGGITLGAETVTLNDTATLLSQSGDNTMSGNLVLNGPGTPEIQVAAGQLEVDGSVSGTGFQKTGAGDLVIDGAVAVSTIDAQAGGTDINGTVDIGAGLTVTGPADVVIDGVVQNGAGAYAQVAANDGAVAHWRLNETSGDAIDVIGGQNGTYTNFAAGDLGVASGQGDGGANFDGTNDHVVGLQGTLNDTHFDGDWTIEAWFTRDDADTDWNGIFSANQNVTNAPLLTFFNAGNGNNRHWLGMNDSGRSATPDIYVDLDQFGGGGGAYLGEQIYATMSLSGTTLAMNVNVAGTWLPTVTTTLARNNLNTTSTGYSIGRHWHSGLYHDGVIDEVAIYDRALTLDEIQSHYAGTGGLTKSGDGTLTLNGTNTFTGEATVTGGTVAAGSNDALGATSGETTVGAGATLALTGGVTLAAETITLDDTGTLENVSGTNTVTGTLLSTGANASVVQSTAGTLNLDGPVTMVGALTFDGAGDTVVDGIISDTGAVGLPAAILSDQGAGGNLDLLESGGSLIAGNIASQSAGAVAFAQDVIGHPTHAIDEVNDEIYGNDSSWIGATDNSFVGVKFAEANSIDAIAWGRSNTNAHTDRDLGIYTIQYTTDAALDTANPGAVTWQTIDSVTYTASYPDGTPHLRHLWGFDAIHNVTGVRILTDSISDASPLAIDELEVHPVALPALTKNGAGTVTLNGDNTYSGDTTVNAGTLLVNGDSSNSGPLDPTDSDFVLWLRADQGILDGAGNAPGDGGFNASDVATWQDQSGNGNHFTQGTSTARPTYVASDATLNNQPVLSFDGTSDFLRNAGLNPSGEFTVLAVTGVNNSTFFDGYLGGGSDRIAFGVNGSANHHPNTFVAWTPGDASTYGLDNSINTDWNLHAYQVAGLDESQWTWSLNGTPTGGPGLTSGLASAYNNGLWVGSSGSSTEFWDGNIAEIIVFDRALSAQELSEAQHLLAARYGLTVANTTAPGGAITVKNGATLGGTGTAGGSVVVESGGTLDPGESGIGTLTVNGDVTVNGNLATEIGSGAANTDLLTVGGTLDVANATLVGSGTGDQVEYVIASYDSATTDPTAFNVVTAPAGYEVKFDAANDQIKLERSTLPVATNDSATAIEAGGVNNATPGTPATGNVITGLEFLQQQESSLIHQYTFSGANPLNDQEGSANMNLFVNGSATLSTDNEEAIFEGNDDGANETYLRAGSNLSVPIDNMTLEFVVTPTVDSGQNQAHIISAVGPDITRFYLAQYDDEIRLALGDNASFQTLIDSSNFNLNTPTYVALRFDYNSGTVSGGTGPGWLVDAFVGDTSTGTLTQVWNNQLYDTGSASFTNWNDDWRFGSNAASGATRWEGELDSVAFYNTQLSDEAIAAHFASAPGDSDANGDDTVATGTATDLTVSNIAFSGTAHDGAVNESLTVSSATTIDGAYGTLVINPDGGYTYTANEGAMGGIDAGTNPQDVFTYTLSDDAGNTATASLTLTVTGVTDEVPFVYVDNSWAGTATGASVADADLGTLENQPAIFGANAFATIADALAAVDPGGTVIVNGGTYAEDVVLANAVTLEITGPDTAGTVTVDSLASADATTRVRVEGDSILQVGGDNGSTSFAGSISGSGTLTKLGSGTLTLTGAVSIAEIDAQAGVIHIDGTVDVAAGGFTVTGPANVIIDGVVQDLDYQSTVLADSPLGYWRLGETSGTTALNLVNPGTFDGTYTGSYAQGESGALSGDADTSTNFATGGSAGYVDIGSLGATPERFTIEFWMNPDTMENYRNPFSTSGAAGGNEGMRFEENAAGNFNVRVGDDGGTPHSSRTLTNSLSPGQWYHVVTTFDTTTNRIVGYLDGVEVFDATHGNDMADFLNDVEIGRGFSTAAGRYWDGDVDEVAIYDRALAQEEVAAHYAIATGTAGTLTKSGAGTLTLNAANTYTGETTVSGGTLLANGDGSSAIGAVTVNANATLGGTGTLGGDVTVDANGTLDPGVTGIGTLTVNGNVTVNGNLAIEIGSGSDNTDLLTIGGTANVANATLQGSGTGDQAEYVIAGYDSAATDPTAFDTVTAPAGYEVRFDADNDQIKLVDIQEPTAPINLDLDASSDSGSSDSDNRTNDNTPTVSGPAGSAESGTTLTLTSDVNGVIGTATVNPDGSWSITPTSPLTEGNHQLTATATDEAGNVSPDSVPLGITVDNTLPAATLSGPGAIESNNPFNVTIDFGEDVTGFIASDIAVSGGTVTKLTQNPDGTYTAEITAEDGPVTVDVAAGVATDPAGNANTAAAQLVTEVDAKAPVPTVTGPESVDKGGFMTVEIDFGEEVSGFDPENPADLVVTNGTVTGVTDNGDGSWSIEVTPAGTDPVSVRVAAGAATSNGGLGRSSAASVPLTIEVEAEAQFEGISGLFNFLNAHKLFSDITGAEVLVIDEIDGIVEIVPVDFLKEGIEEQLRGIVSDYRGYEVILRVNGFETSDVLSIVAKIADEESDLTPYLSVSGDVLEWVISRM